MQHLRITWCDIDEATDDELSVLIQILIVEIRDAVSNIGHYF